MRVIGGEFGSRRIKSLPGVQMRPTPDRLRETLFDILSGQIEGSTFLDAYAGTGAVGIEALSRGAARAIFLEKHKSGAALIRENLKSLGLVSRALVVEAPALRELAKHRANIVFLDPPYSLERDYATALDMLSRMHPGMAIAQHSVRFDPGERHGALSRMRMVRQGDNALSFYRIQE